MINITAGSFTYDLKTTLGVAIKLEQKFKLPLTEIFGKIESADISELISILAVAAGKENDSEFKNSLLDNWDYTDLQFSVQELLIRLMFSGSDEQIEKKIAKFPTPEQQKNVFREMLNLPIKQVYSTANNSSEQLSE